MKTRADYEKALKVVGQVINAWDPEYLLAGGAPDDEYAPEIAKVATCIPRIHSVTDAVQAISEVFSKMINPVDFTPGKCVVAGTSLYRKLVEAGLVSPSPSERHPAANCVG